MVVKLVNVLNKILTFQMKNCHYETIMKSYIPYWIILQQDIQNLFNYFLSIIFALISQRIINLYTLFIH